MTEQPPTKGKIIVFGILFWYPLVGVTWRAGGVRGKKDTVKSVPPRELGAALRDAPGTILSLQRLPEPGETEAFLAGHFPGRPIVPGVLIAEALGQVSGLVAASGDLWFP